MAKDLIEAELKRVKIESGGIEEMVKNNWNKKRREILDFARDHNMVINPGRGYDYYVDSFYKFKACPCDATRLECPCPDAVEEVKKDGWCKCRLFWRNHDTFKNSHVPEVS